MKTLKDILNTQQAEYRLKEILKYKASGDYPRSCFGAVINPLIYDLGEEAYNQQLKSDRNIELAQWSDNCYGWMSPRLVGYKTNQDCILRCDNCAYEYEAFYNKIYSFRSKHKRNPKVTFTAIGIEIEEEETQPKKIVSPQKMSDFYETIYDSYSSMYNNDKMVNEILGHMNKKPRN